MKINVVILQNALLHYRVPFYESLGQSVDLKVVHSGEMRCTNAHFRNKTVNSWKIGPFTVQSGLYREIKSADIIKAAEQCLNLGEYKGENIYFKANSANKIVKIVKEHENI